MIKPFGALNLRKRHGLQHLLRFGFHHGHRCRLLACLLKVYLVECFEPRGASGDGKARSIHENGDPASGVGSMRTTRSRSRYGSDGFDKLAVGGSGAHNGLLLEMLRVARATY
jgi:hypothetical protein